MRDSASPGRAGSRPSRAARATRGRRLLARRRSRAAPSARRSGRRCVLHRVERVHRALEDHRDVLPAVRADRLLAAARGCRPRRAGPRRRPTPSAAAAPSSRGSSSSCRSRTRRPARAARPRASAKRHALDGVQLAAARQVEPDVAGPRPRAGRSRRSLLAPRPGARQHPEAPHREVADPQPRVERVLDASGRSSCRRGSTSVTQTPGGTIAHQALVDDRRRRRTRSRSAVPTRSCSGHRGRGT